MRYALRIVRGRSNAKMLKLIDGVTSIGRHDDCLIRVRSSQVSRRHCEIYEENGTLTIRDLGSSNGTFVNGKRVLGQQALSPGDLLTIGTVTLSVDLLRPAREGVQAPPASAPKSGDTAQTKATASAKVDNLEMLEAVEDDELEMAEDDEEFEVAIDDEPQHADLIPVADINSTSLATDSPKLAGAAKTAHERSNEQSKVRRSATKPVSQAPEPESSSPEDDAVAQFLLDLKLDDDD